MHSRTGITDIEVIAGNPLPAVIGGSLVNVRRRERTTAITLVKKRAPKLVDGKRANKNGIRMTLNKEGERRWEVQIRRADLKFYEGGITNEEEAIRIRDKAIASASSTAQPKRASGMPVHLTMAEVFEMYVKAHGKLSYSQRQMFDRLKVHPLLATVKLGAMCYSVVAAYCKARLAEGVEPSTLQAEYA